MDLQSIFYIMAIILMTLGILISIGILGLVIFVFVKVVHLSQLIEKKLNRINGPAELAISAGSIFLKSFFSRKS